MPCVSDPRDDLRGAEGAGREVDVGGGRHRIATAVDHQPAGVSCVPRTHRERQRFRRVVDRGHATEIDVAGLVGCEAEPVGERAVDGGLGDRRVPEAGGLGRRKPAARTHVARTAHPRGDVVDHQRAALHVLRRRDRVDPGDVGEDRRIRSGERGRPVPHDQVRPLRLRLVERLVPALHPRRRCARRVAALHHLRPPDGGIREVQRDRVEQLVDLGPAHRYRELGARAEVVGAKVDDDDARGEPRVAPPAEPVERRRLASGHRRVVGDHAQRRGQVHGSEAAVAEHGGQAGSAHPAGGPEQHRVAEEADGTTRADRVDVLVAELGDAPGVVAAARRRCGDRCGRNGDGCQRRDQRQREEHRTASHARIVPRRGRRSPVRESMAIS